MDPMWILFVGMALVIGGVLVGRLPAFLALAIGAFAVGWLTPPERVAVSQVLAGSLAVGEVDQADAILRVKTDRQADKKGLKPGAELLVVRAPGLGEPGALRVVGDVRVAADPAGGPPTVRWRARGEDRPQPGDWMVTSGLLAQATATSRRSVGDRVASGFGATCGSIGIVIALASIIGKCLLDSGAADRIVRVALRVFGEARAGVALVAASFVLGIPVFFDTVFYLMVPLAKALRMRLGRNYLLYVLAIVAGATMTHSLVPPTPGPLAVAELLGVNQGVMMLGGSLVGLCTVSVGYGIVLVLNRRIDVPLRGTRDLSLEELERISRQPDSALPPAWLAFAPILLPVLLIGGAAASGPWQGVEGGRGRVAAVLDVLGEKNLALGISAALAIVALVLTKRTSRAELGRSLSDALDSAGAIILITAAGGAFGGVLQQTGITERLQGLAATYHLPLLPLAFLVTVMIRTAQGSATVAMITAAGVLGGVADPGQLGFHPVYLALAIACGSKPFAWMNDSGFWVICKMSGMTEAEGLRTITPLTATMGFVGLGVVMLAAAVWPLV